MSSLKLISVDLDDTVWPCRPPLAAAEHALYDWLQANAEALAQAHTQESLRDHRRALAAQRPDMAHDLTALRRLSLQTLLNEYGYDPALAEAAMDLFLDYRNRVAPYDDVFPVLRALAADHAVVSLTNGNADVERTPLRGHFHRAFRAEEVGAAKPDPAMFMAALRWAGAKAQFALHIGDDPWLDVEAARRCGMRAVWVNRHAQTWPQELTPPTLELADFSALPNWILRNLP